MVNCFLDSFFGAIPAVRSIFFLCSLFGDGKKEFHFIPTLFPIQKVSPKKKDATSIRAKNFGFQNYEF